ncbi:MAG: RnfABCDGE type electron transport complex subunit G [Chlorobi bacterium]|nr:RnfABCDGE type electron transport complex subunit G [Chlorobiota bacterium]
MAKKESSFMNMVLTLLVVTIVAALALGGVYTVTKGPIAIAKRKKVEKAIGQVVPAFDTIMREYKLKPATATGKDSLTFFEAWKGGEKVGTAVKTYTDEGFGGKIWIMVGFDSDGTINNTAVLEHKETPGLGDKMDIKKSDFSKQFIGKNPKDFKLQVTKDGGDVDAITAATISSRAFCDAVKRGYEAFEKESKGKQE